jgi:hypothetical protein
MAPKYLIFAEGMSFEDWKLDYETQVLKYSVKKLEC